MGYMAVDQIAWDGHKRTGCQRLLKADPIHRYSGSIASETGTVVWSGYWAPAILDFTPDSDGMSIAHLVHMGTWKLIGRKKIGGYDAWGIRGSGVTVPRFVDDSYEIWVVPDHDFAIVEMSDIVRPTKGKPMQCHLTNAKLKQWGSFWALSYGEIRITNLNVGATTAVNAFEVHAFSLGAPAKTRFAVKFPVGAGVFDAINQTSFIAGKLVFSRQPDGSFQVIPIAKFPEYASMTDYTKGMTAAEWNKSPWAARLKQAIASMSSAGAAKAQEHGK
jgi:hypothetical protein